MSGDLSRLEQEVAQLEKGLAYTIDSDEEARRIHLMRLIEKKVADIDMYENMIKTMPQEEGSPLPVYERKITQLQSEILDLQKQLEGEPESDGGAHQSRARRVLFIQQQKQSGKKLRESINNKQSEHNTSRHIDKYKHQENIKQDQTYQMIRLQQEIQSMIEKDPKLTEMADYLNSKIGPVLTKLKIKPSRQWDNLFFKIGHK